MKKQRGPSPDGRIRQSSLSLAYGPGSLVDLVDRSVVIASIDTWRPKEHMEPVDEPRLRDAVRDVLRSKALDYSASFRLPPTCDPDHPQRGAGIAAYEFPAWFVCKGCKQLSKLGHQDRKDMHHSGCEHHGVWQPVRFVAACPKGHLGDFNWSGFTHSGTPCGNAHLEMHEGEVGDISEISVKCKGCGAYRKLVDALTKSAGMRCFGDRVWMGDKDPAGCEIENVDLIVRTASNAYFAQTMSALTLPSENEELRIKVGDLYKTFNVFIKTREDLERAYDDLSVRYKLQGYSLAAVWDMWERNVRNEADSGDQPVRTAEFDFLRNAAKGVSNPPPEPRPHLQAIDFAHPLINRVVLVKRIREVRALVGFTRIAPSIPDLQGAVKVHVAPLGEEAWLPCAKMWGEGVFLSLDEERVQAWERRPAVQARHNVLLAGYKKWRDKQRSPTDTPVFPGARFYMLHSLAHALMTSMSLTCGYAASAIRERIYCSEPDDKVKVAGILLVTGATGSEGTLGGLVEQGRFLHEHLARAREDLRLCSGDPLCGKHSPMGRGERHLLGAACHNCLLVSESSCEWFNLRLDRALLFPTLGQDPACAFFGGT